MPCGMYNSVEARVCEELVQQDGGAERMRFVRPLIRAVAALKIERL